MYYLEFIGSNFISHADMSVKYCTIIVCPPCFWSPVVMISKNNTSYDLRLNPIWYLCKGDRELMAQPSNDDTIIDYDFFNYGYLRSK